jgi:hypothetical protein
MPKFSPKDLPADAWRQLLPQRSFAFRANPDETLFFRFGQGHGVYISVAPAIAGRAVNIIDMDTTEATLAGKIPLTEPALIGRTSDCTIKIMHAIISRHHLRFELNGNILVAQDVGSTNGTYFLADLLHFDIDEYIENHPLDRVEERTLDAIHEAFGPTLDDFLRSYSQKKGNEK